MNDFPLVGNMNNVVWVDPLIGNDSKATGKWGRPFKTLQKAHDCPLIRSGFGDEIHVQCSSSKYPEEIMDSVVISKKCVSFIGSGKSLRFHPAHGCSFIFLGGEGIEIRDFYMEGSGAGSGFGLNSYGGGWNVHHCWFENWPYAAMDVGHNGMFVDNEILNSNTALENGGGALWSRGDNSKVARNIFRFCGSGGGVIGIHDGDGWIITDNIFVGTIGDGLDIDLHDSTNCVVARNILSDRS